ncbi:LOW QUALITY PROTEIN: carboxylesterase 3 [Dugong dugon]
MGTMVRAGTKVQIWAACLLLAFPAMAADKTHLPGLQAGSFCCRLTPGPSALPSEPGVAHPEVDTALGHVRGLEVGVKGTDRRVNVFLGVPFAQAPQGPGQFSALCPAQSWEGVQDASTAPAMCLQEMKRMNNFRFLLNDLRVFSISEDCLILNIYSPAGATTGAGRPVMVWMHGGSMMIGAATSQDGSALAAFGDVLVVTIYTGDRHGPGNWAFLDVVAALHWVQGNITPFGGNPNCVTIFGESAGGLIVSALVLSLLAVGLFHRAIAQSGIITFPGILDSDSLSLAQDFADSLACSSNSTAEMLQCLQKTGEEMILTKESRQKIRIMLHTTDGTFFPKSPQELLKERQFHPVPFLVGITNHKMSWVIPQMKMSFGPCALQDPALDIPPELWLTVIDDYLGNTSDPWTQRDALLDLLSDICFNFSTLNFSRNLDFGVPIFFYEFHHPSSFVKTKPDWVRVDHGAELAFMFGGPFLKDESSFLAFPEATEEEKQLRLTMMAQWTQFARTGDPNGEGLPYWPLFNQLEQYLEVSPVPRVGQKLREARMKFWAETLPTNIRQWQQKQKGRKAQEEL